jgi:hypothetical protein
MKKAEVSRVKVRAIPVEVYSRVVGYFRPVQNWNKGKQQEFTERKHIPVSKLTNRRGDRPPA